MPGATVDTTMRVHADTAQAVQNVGRLDKAMMVMKTRSVPALGTGFSTLTQQLYLASGGTQALGLQSSSLASMLSVLGGSIAMLSPIVAGLSMVGIAAAAMFLKKKEAVDKATASLKKNTEALELQAAALNTVIERNKDLMVPLDRLRQERIRETQLEIESLKARIKETISLRDNAQAIRDRTDIHLAGVAASIHARDEVTKHTKELEKMTAQLEKEQTNLRILTQEEKKAREAKDRANAARQRQLQLQREQAAVLAMEIDVRKRLNALDTRQAEYNIRNAETIDQINAAYERKKQTAIDAARIEIETTDVSAQQMVAIKMDLDQTLAEIDEQRLQRLQQVAAKELQIAKAREMKLRTLQMKAQAFFMAAVQGRLSILQAASKAMLQTVADEVAKELETRAVLWAAQAIAAAASYQYHRAAMYTAAAAAATAGAGMIRYAAQQAFMEPMPEFKAEGELGGGIAGTETAATQRGRTLISQGPITLNYSAVQIIHGNVYGLDDLYDLFTEWNQDQLRTAGADVTRRAQA